MPCRAVLLCAEVAAANSRTHQHCLQFTEDRFKVVYKRPTDLKLKEDVPVCCNLLVANIFDEGGLLAALTQLRLINTAAADVLTQWPECTHRPEH
jgi:hypothetical protein